MTDEDNGRANGAGTGDGPQGEREDSDEQPRITLERYISRRRAPPRGGLAQLVAAVVMLVALVLIILYKDRCGQVVSGVMGELNQPAAPPTRPVRIELPSEKTRGR